MPTLPRRTDNARLMTAKFGGMFEGAHKWEVWSASFLSFLEVAL